MNIAIFADLHGRILLALKLCARWQIESGERIDLILQSGDMGIIATPEQMDKATLRHADRDPSEAGFGEHFSRPNQQTSISLSTLKCNLVFVRGNHEDHQWLDTLEGRDKDVALFSVDAYGRLWCLKTGWPWTFKAGEEKICVLGIGRIGAGLGTEESRSSKTIQDLEIERLAAIPSGYEIDIILSHDCAPDYPNARSLGMEVIRNALDRHRPTYHIFGHVGGCFNSGLDRNGVSRFIKMADMAWGGKGDGFMLNSGIFGILSWKSRREHDFQVVNAPWLKEYARHNWQYL